MALEEWCLGNACYVKSMYTNWLWTRENSMHWIKQMVFWDFCWIWFTEATPRMARWSRTHPAADLFWVDAIWNSHDRKMDAWMFSRGVSNWTNYDRKGENYWLQKHKPCTMGIGGCSSLALPLTPKSCLCQLWRQLGKMWQNTSH